MVIPEITIGTGIIAWVSALITIAVGLAIKDLVTTLVGGFLFFMNKDFNEGDHVFLDGEKAIIVKIGLRQTVFGIDNGRGLVWRYVYNHKISSLKLEKVITPNEEK